MCYHKKKILKKTTLSQVNLLFSTNQLHNSSLEGHLTDVSSVYINQLHHVTQHAQQHQDRELVKAMDAAFVGGDGLDLMQNTYYLDSTKIEYW